MPRNTEIANLEHEVTPKAKRVLIVDATGKNNLPVTLGYTSGDLTTLTKTDGVTSWVKTLGYTSGDLTSVSAWVEV